MEKIVVITTSKPTLEREEIEKAMLSKPIQEYDRIEALKIALESSMIDIKHYEKEEDFNAKHKGKYGQNKSHPNHYARNRFGRG